jgi:anthranilate synthase/aminodeoxychorismate synthase-like glutamine amidotransferase
MILLIDNYDSFVHNLARYVTRLGCDAHVVRNDAIDAEGVRRLNPCAVILSPGPCAPQQAGCSLEVVRDLHRDVPMLGICLGHQAIAEALGGRIVRAAEPVHGRSSPIEHDGSGLFAGLPSPLSVGRYHSLCVEQDTLPRELRVTARSDDGVIMAFEHAERPVFGVQFHPESVLTDGGYRILANFLRAAGQTVADDLPTLDDERTPPRAERPLPAGPVTF